MTRLQTILSVVGLVIAALVFESYLGSTGYNLNGETYVVPHKHEFIRQVNIPWLRGLKGLDKEPEESIWLLFAPNDLTRDIPGYSRWFRGYSDQYEADAVVNVLGGTEAQEFPDDRKSDIHKVRQQVLQGSPRRVDPSGVWERVYWSVGEKGTPGEGNDLFYLIPRTGLDRLPVDWRVPSCRSAPDVNGKETYSCLLTIQRGRLNAGFYVRSENLPVANSIANYAIARLDSWRR